ncbi:MAG: TrpB-like pyridoxal phosphate-dependent enzyme [Candidatus Omnitrophica bacterium]|nr:TrpB-like pyridoxal phosphate-dependent enzyme [Candidatus Omnitrophota bacterium]
MKIILPEKDLPKQWYNILGDLPWELPPPIDPLTKKPISLEERNSVFCRELLEQDNSQEKWIDIPQEVREVLTIWRPTPLRRARNLEKHLKTECRIYYKDESCAPAGSFKQNTAIAQAYYFKKAGFKRLTTETGAGQWGSALSFACNEFGLKCRVYMVKISCELKPYREYLMKLWGAEVIPSPSKYTSFGRKILKDTPHTNGSLGISASEAVEEAFKNKDTGYGAASIFNFVNLHQTVIGLELKKQLRLIGDEPAYLIGCVGGGSNFAGLIFPFVKEKINGKEIKFIAVEPYACPSLTKGKYLYDFADSGCFSNLIKMYTLGHNFIPPPIHTTGLRYHGCSPVVSLLKYKNIIEAKAYHQLDVLKAGILFAKLEGILPAVETTYAIKAAIDIAKENKTRNKCIVFNFSGHGYFDLHTYQSFLHQELKNYRYPISKIKLAIKEIEKLQPK